MAKVVVLPMGMEEDEGTPLEEEAKAVDTSPALLHRDRHRLLHLRVINLRRRRGKESEKTKLRRVELRVADKLLLLWMAIPRQEEEDQERVIGELVRIRMRIPERIRGR